MGTTTAIEWADHTFNPWRGCTKVSKGCATCYAERMSKRNPKVLGIWGDAGTRVIASEAMWRQPERWNQIAEACRERHLPGWCRPRVFSASLADVFEDRPELVAPRDRLGRLIGDTPWLDWLLLTKRPENAERLVPAEWMIEGWPENVWLGTSVENQPTADERIPHLLKTRARTKFLSVEPLLGPVDLMRICHSPRSGAVICGPALPVKNPPIFGHGNLNPEGRGIDWVIVGGESGPHARPMHPDWLRAIRDQCVAADVPFFFKQWGEFGPVPRPSIVDFGGDDVVIGLEKIGKKAAGRLLDGREWNEFPRFASRGKAKAGVR